MSWLSRVRSGIPFLPKRQTTENLWHKCRKCGTMREVDAGLVAAKTHVAEHEVDFLARQHIECLIQIVDRSDDLVTGVAEHIFIVERGKRFILDNEYALDDLLASPEQHQNPEK